MDDGMTLKSLRADDKNLDARIYVVDGKPLKSILKKPKESKTNASGSQQHLRAGSAMEDPEKAIYNKNFPCLVTNRPNSVSLVKGADGKPFQVRRKVVIALDESNTEYDEIDVSSSKTTRAMETETCNKPPQVVIESTKNDDSSMDNLVTHHTDPTCEVHADENQISKPTSVESDANDVNGSSPQMKTGSYASVVNDHDQVNSTTNDGCKFKSKGTKRVNFRSLVSEERVDNSDTVLPMDAMEKVKNRYVYSLVGYFVSKSIAFPIVQNYVKNTWAKFGLQNLTKNKDGVFLFKFDSKDGLDRVLERGIWIIRNTPLILNRWTPNLYLKRDEIIKVPVWVKLHNVPVVSYSADGLSLIATQVRKPFMLDAFTSSMCDDS
ncbi:nucleotide-binding alpha-beta plait domain-containing protein [Tanacetum coccineum]